MGRQPITHIIQALNVAHKVEAERANHLSIAIANFGVAYFQSQGVEGAKPEWFNPWIAIIKEQEIKDAYSKESLEILYDLLESENLPIWVYKQLDNDLIDYLQKY